MAGQSTTDKVSENTDWCPSQETVFQTDPYVLDESRFPIEGHVTAVEKPKQWSNNEQHAWNNPVVQVRVYGAHSEEDQHDEDQIKSRTDPII